jgi:hypothetical protein
MHACTYLQVVPGPVHICKFCVVPLLLLLLPQQRLWLP